MAAIKKLLKKSYSISDVRALVTESLFRPVNGKTMSEKDAAKAIVRVAEQTGASVSPAVRNLAMIKQNPAPKRKTAARTQRAAESYVRRPSQITKKAPSKRLKTRRTKNLQVPRGVFPNPATRQFTGFVIETQPDKYVKIKFPAATAKSYGVRPAKPGFVKLDPTGEYVDASKWIEYMSVRESYGMDDGAVESLANDAIKYAHNKKPFPKMKKNPDSVHFDIDVNSHNARGSRAKTRVNPAARKKEIIVEYELSGHNFAKRNRGMYEWKELAKFPDTPEGSENAIQYAQAYHKIAPHLRIQVVTK